MKQIAVANEAFFDTNILLHILERSGRKYELAIWLVDKGGVISVQVLNEFVNSAWKKFRFPYVKSAQFLLELKENLRVVSLTSASHERALEIALANDIGIYDANILAAAQLAGCNVLYTEDLNNGQRIGGVTIVNPFA